MFKLHQSRYSPINDFGDYQISKYGYVYNKQSKKILKLRRNDKGYFSFQLCKNGVKHIRLLHRILTEPFCETPNNYNIVNHKDRNTFNHNIGNLEWCTI